MTNTLYTGDNLYILHGLNSESVDLIYLDPPFNSKRTYSAPIDSKAAGASFSDMWTWDDVDEGYLESLVQRYPALVSFIESISGSHSKAMMAYITYMAQRVVELHRILKPTGSIYLHCDPTASHYLKIMMDNIFGRDNFRNEIVWCYKSGGATKKYFAKKHDIILCHCKSQDKSLFNSSKQKSYMGFNYSTGNKNVQLYDDDDGMGLYTLTFQKDWWDDIGMLATSAKERTGYPTQKPLALLKRIIEASSNEDDVVLDPFCGCATTCVAAQDAKRRWIGIDIEKQAADILVQRITDSPGRLYHDFIHTDNRPERTDITRESPSIPIKHKLFTKQKGACNGCYTIFEEQHLTIDHIIPKSKGGGDHEANYQLLCGNCNSIKGNRPMQYLRAKLEKRKNQLNSISFGE